MGHMRANESHQLVPDRQSEQCQLQPQQDGFKSLPRDWDYITLLVMNSTVDLQDTVKDSEWVGLGIRKVSS